MLQAGLLCWNPGCNFPWALWIFADAVASLWNALSFLYQYFLRNIPKALLWSLLQMCVRVFPSPSPDRDHPYFLFNKFIYFIYFIFGCVGSSLLRAGFPLVAVSGSYSSLGVWASHCGGFSCCRAWALGVRASVVVACGLSSCSSWA